MGHCRFGVTRLFAITLGLGLLLCTGSAFAQPGWIATDLGTLGGSSAYGYGINNAGHVVGSSSTGSFEHAFLWTPAIGMQDLGSVDLSSSSEARAINDVDQVVGWCLVFRIYPYDPYGSHHACRLSGEGGSRDARGLMVRSEWHQQRRSRGG